MYSPKYSITPKINSQIAEIERLRILVEQSKILPTKEVVLRQRASVEATRSSTGIEGNPLNMQEVALVLSGQKISASERFITEVLNYKKALSYVERKIKLVSVLSLREILTIHEIAMKDLLPRTKAGKLRQTPIYVVDIVGGKEILKYEGPKPDQLLELMEDLLTWIREKNTELHPLLIAGILHYEFVSIHPFADGNGRVTRLLTLQYLYQNGFAFRSVLVPDSYYFADRQKYYMALNQARKYNDQRAADLTPWLEYFMDGMLSVIRELSEKISLASVTGDSKDVVTLTPEDYEIIDLVSVMGKLTTGEIISSIKISKRTAQRRLNRLVHVGILIKFGRGPVTKYDLKKR